jgi:hypothetical protein
MRTRQHKNQPEGEILENGENPETLKKKNPQNQNYLKPRQ